MSPRGTFDETVTGSAWQVCGLDLLTSVEGNDCWGREGHRPHLTEAKVSLRLCDLK
jgi:hypothetical protein